MLSVGIDGTLGDFKDAPEPAFAPGSVQNERFLQGNIPPINRLAGAGFRGLAA